MILYYTILSYPILCYAMLCYAMLCYAMLCYAMLCYAMLCYAMLRCAVLCYAMLCYAMLCYAMLCYAMLCYAILYYAMLRYAILYFAIITKEAQVHAELGALASPRSSSSAPAATRAQRRPRCLPGCSRTQRGPSIELNTYIHIEINSRERERGIERGAKTTTNIVWRHIC